MGGGKGGQADQSGMYQALVSAQAAQQAYALGSQELDWSKQQWAQEYPYMQQIAQGQIDTQKQTEDFSRNQQQFYEQQYQPMEAQYNKAAQDWASPQNIALQAGTASANVAEGINAQKSSAQEQLEGYGVNPGSTRFASLGAAMGVQGGAAEAGAGTQAAMATKMQGMQLVGGAVNTGRGFPNAVATLSGASTGAGSAGSQGITSGMQTGSNMMTAPSAWYNAGANNMSVYTGAVNGYNQAQVGFAQASATEMAGFGSAAGSLMGMAMFHPWTGEAGGPVERYEDGGTVIALPRRPNPYSSGGHYSPPVGYVDGGAIPTRYFQAGPTAQPQPQPQPANNNQQPPPPIPPQNGTPGGIITPQMSPSKGQVPDDVDAKLTVGEFVMPLDVVRFKGKEYFYKQIDSSRKQEAMQNARGDIGGEPTTALPSRNPQFVSRPNTMPGAMPARAVA
jgi:hypothetical protein